MKVALFDLKKQTLLIKNDVKAAIERVLDSGQFILGPDVSALEREVEKYLNVKHAVGVASGTDALLLSLIACRIKKGDEVITTPFTFIATAEAIVHAGAKPVFADILPDTYTIDPAKIEGKITKKTKAILPVHMYGQSCDMDSISAIAQKHGLSIIEDTAQGFGAMHKENFLGTIGNAGCFSFFPTKNLGAFGDAGMVTTNDDTIAAKIRKLRVHGSEKKYIHDVIGYNSRLDSLQAAIIRIKLNYIDEWNEKRRHIATLYNKLLRQNKNIILPVEKEGNRHIYHQYAIRVKNRDSLQNYLQKKEIGTAIHYPITVFEQTCFTYLNCSQDELFLSHKASHSVLCLPIYPELKDEEAEYVSNEINNFLT